MKAKGEIKTNQFLLGLFANLDSRCHFPGFDEPEAKIKREFSSGLKKSERIKNDQMLRRAIEMWDKVGLN